MKNKIVVIIGVILLSIPKFLLAQDFQTGIYYNITNSSGLAVDTRGLVQNNVNLFLLKQVAKSSSQAWTFSTLGNGFYSITSPVSFKSIDNAKKSTSGTPVVLWDKDDYNNNQQWKSPERVMVNSPLPQRQMVLICLCR